VATSRQQAWLSEVLYRAWLQSWRRHRGRRRFDTHGTYAHVFAEGRGRRVRTPDKANTVKHTYCKPLSPLIQIRIGLFLGVADLGQAGLWDTNCSPFARLITILHSTFVGSLLIIIWRRAICRTVVSEYLEPHRYAYLSGQIVPGAQTR